MGGRRRVGLVLQPRDATLLRILDTFRVLDRNQACQTAPFRSVTRANSRLLQLTRAGLLMRLTVGTVRGGHKHLYARTRQGAAAVDQPYRPPPWNAHSPIIAGQPLLEHQLRLNETYLALHRVPPATGITVRSWQTYRTPPFKAVATLIPDAYVELTAEDDARRRAYFLEIDLATEPLKTWQNKAERYVALARAGSVEQKYGVPHFGVMVLVPSLRRVHTVRAAVAPITTRLFFFTTFADLHEAILRAPVWWRPAGDLPVPLIS